MGIQSRSAVGGRLAGVCLLALIASSAVSAQTYEAESIYNTLAIYDSSRMSEEQLQTWRNLTTFAMAAGIKDKRTWAEVHGGQTDVFSNLGAFTTGFFTSDRSCSADGGVSVAEALAAAMENTEIPDATLSASLFDGLLTSQDVSSDLEDSLKLWLGFGTCDFLAECAGTQNDGLSLMYVDGLDGSSIRMYLVQVELPPATVPRSAEGSVASALGAQIGKGQPLALSVVQTVYEMPFPSSIFNQVKDTVASKLAESSTVAASVAGPNALPAGFEPVSPSVATAACLGSPASPEPNPELPASPEPTPKLPASEMPADLGGDDDSGVMGRYSPAAMTHAVLGMATIAALALIGL